MEKLFQRLNRIRFLRNILFLSVFLFGMLVMLLNHFFIKEEWVSVLIVFDNLLVIVGLFFLIEVKVGKDYELLYHHEFIPLLLKSINSNYHYEKNPRTFKGNFMNVNIFDYDSKIRINHLVHMKDSLNEYMLYDAEIYIPSKQSTKIVQFNGYIIVLPSINTENDKALLMYHKKPYLGSYKELTELKFINYKVYEKTHQKINYNLFNKLKQVVLKYPKAKLYVCIDNKTMIFKSNRFSFFRKPIYKKINQSFFEFKKNEFKKLDEMIVYFIRCFK